MIRFFFCKHDRVVCGREVSRDADGRQRDDLRAHGRFAEADRVQERMAQNQLNVRRSTMSRLLIAELEVGIS